MSTEQKVALAREAERGHALSPVLEALELPRSTWYYHQSHRVSYTAKYAHLREPLETIAREHPGYGYRRTTAELREAYEYRTNHKVVQRLHQEWELPLIRGTRLPKPSGIRRVIAAAGERINLVATREAIPPFGVAYTDFTELVYADGRRKAHMIPIADHASKLALGWAVGERAVAGLALQAWEQSRQTLKAQGVELKEVIVHHDQDPVFTSDGWTSCLLLRDRVRVSYALNGARDNPQMESFIGRFKTENRSLLLDAQTLDELQAVVAERMNFSNNRRRHSTIGYQVPTMYIASLQPWP
ncbi:MAG TPA: IS3 family transposase [Anaerolineae bacterium]|nr:IS3 family transposase [Anaerolineae bacterium]